MRLRPEIRRRTLVALVACAVATAAEGARADEPDRATAEVLFDQGRKLLDQGKVDEACAKLEASQRAEPAVGTLLNLGECNERRARLASAWGNYRAAASLAESRGDASRADYARKRARALEPKVPSLTIDVVGAPVALVVKRDGVVIDQGAWRTALPTDAGKHVVEATSPSTRPWSAEIVVPADPAAKTTLQVGPFVTGDGGDTATPVAGPSSPPAATPPRVEPARDAAVAPASSDRGSSQRVLGIAGMALGGIALGASGLFALHAKSQWDDAKPHCDAVNRCDDVGLGLNHDARTSGNIATAFFVTGVALVAAGAVVTLLAPSSPAPAKAVRAAGLGVSFP